MTSAHAHTEERERESHMSLATICVRDLCTSTGIPEVCNSVKRGPEIGQLRRKRDLLAPAYLSNLLHAGRRLHVFGELLGVVFGKERFHVMALHWHPPHLCEREESARAYVCVYIFTYTHVHAHTHNAGQDPPLLFSTCDRAPLECTQIPVCSFTTDISCRVSGSNLCVGECKIV